MRVSRLAILGLALIAAACGDKKSNPKFDCAAPVGTKFDSDGDLLTDVAEAALGTDPQQADTDGDLFSDYVEVSAGTDPALASSAPSGAVASVHQITNASDLIGGPGAQGQVGDWLLQNDEIRAIVQRHDAEQMQLGTYGGNLIDADVLRPVGTPGNDRVGMVIPFMSIGVTSRPDKTLVIADGTDGGAAILRTCGADDTYEYLDLAATFTLFGFGVNYDTNADYSVKMSNDYVLAPGSNVIEVITTVANEGPTLQFPIGDVIDSGGAEEIFATNTLGFGQVGFANLTSVQPPTRFMGFLAPGSSWGYITDGGPNMSVTVSGVSVFLQEFTSAFDALGSDPEGDPRPGMNLVKKGGRFSFHRGIQISDGAGAVEPFNAEYHRRQFPSATVHTGSAADVNGPMAGVRVVALTSTPGVTDTDRLPFAVTESDAAGDYALTLPPGDYYIAADKPGRPFPTYSSGALQTITTRYDLHSLDAVLLTVGAATALPDLTFTLPGTINGSFVDAITGQDLPARITVVGTDPSPNDSIFRDQKERTANNIVANWIDLDGNNEFELEPGTYDFYGSHGMEYSLGRSIGQVATAGVYSSFNVAMMRVVDTPGYISGDFHVHMMNSPDSPVPLLDRTVNGVVEGLDVLIATDHDYVTDLSPIVATLGVGSSMAPVVGEEITTWASGHFIAFPMVADPTKADGGAEKWAGGAGAISHRTAAEIFADIDAANPGTQVEQVCHARGFKLQSYYTAIELDTSTLATQTDPAFLRTPAPAGSTPADTKLFYGGFDAQEVFNGADAFGTPNAIKNLNDFFTMLSHGMQIVGTGNSDTHKVYSGQLGWPRNYVKLADDSPANLPANQEAFAQSIVDGHTYFSTGPQLLVTAVGATTGGPGDLIDPAGTTVTITANVSMPDWIGVDTLHIYVNTPGTASLSDEDGNPVAPVPQYTVPIVLGTSLVPGNTLGGPFFRRTGVVTQPVTVSATGDSWIVVTAEGLTAASPSLFPVLPYPGLKSFALANAVFVDGNANGTFDAPGVAAVARPSHKGPPLKHWDAKKGEIPKQATPDIREQFERLSAGSCDRKHDRALRAGRGSAPDPAHTGHE